MEYKTKTLNLVPVNNGDLNVYISDSRKRFQFS